MKRSKDKKHKRKIIKKGWGKRLEKEGEKVGKGGGNYGFISN